MLERIDSNDLVEGQMYFVIDKFLGTTDNLIFTGYSFFKFPNKDPNYHNNYSFRVHLSSNTFHRYVSKEEYYAKVKEKYDAKCLNIVLKRLVNETFEW